jgi:ABC-2 type transport system permease protein
MKHIIAVIKFEAPLILRNFPVIFFSVVFPVGLMALFGYIFGNKPSAEWGGHGMIDVSLPAYLGIGLAVSGILSFPLSVAHYRERKVLKRFKATPLNPLAILGAQFLLNSFLAVISTALMFCVSMVLFHYTFRGSLLSFLLVFILVLLSIFSIGMVIASVAKRERTAQITANILYFILIFLSGSTIPFEIMPIPMQKAMEVVPLTHGIILLKMTSLGSHVPGSLHHVVVLISIIIVGGIISMVTFRWE